MEVMEVDDCEPGPSKPKEATQSKKADNLPW